MNPINPMHGTYSNSAGTVEVVWLPESVHRITVFYHGAVHDLPYGNAAMREIHRACMVFTAAIPPERHPLLTCWEDTWDSWLESFVGVWLGIPFAQVRNGESEKGPQP